MRRDIRLLAASAPGAPTASPVEMRRLRALLARMERRNQELRRQVVELRAELRQRRGETTT
jgi:hypothetical protein